MQTLSWPCMNTRPRAAQALGAGYEAALLLDSALRLKPRGVHFVGLQQADSNGLDQGKSLRYSCLDEKENYRIHSTW